MDLRNGLQDLVTFFSLREAPLPSPPHPDPTQHPETEPKRSETEPNGAETEPNGAEMDRNQAFWGGTGGGFVGVRGVGGCNGKKNHYIDISMGLFRGAVFRHGLGARKQPIKQPTEMPTSTMALMGRSPSLMGRFPTLMGRFPDFVLRGRFTSSKPTGKQPFLKKRGIKRFSMQENAHVGAHEGHICL